MAKYYNKKTHFRAGDLIFRNNEASRTESSGKLDANGEETYKVVEVFPKGNYKLVR